MKTMQRLANFFLAPLLAVSAATVNAQTEKLVLRVDPGDEAVEFADPALPGGVAAPAGSLGENRVMALRFNDVAIPAGATIKKANLRFYVAEGGSDDSAIIQYSAELSTDPEPFGLGGRLSERRKTYARMPGVLAEWRPGAWHRSRNLKQVLQNIVDQPGWAPGNSLVIFASGFSGSGRAEIATAAANPKFAPRLIVKYDAAPEGGLTAAGTPEAPTPDAVKKCKYDTDRDGKKDDIILFDNDGDGFCELPSDKTIEFLGKLVIKQKLEVMSRCDTASSVPCNQQPGLSSRSGAGIVGDFVRLAAGATFIPDTDSPNPSSDYPTLDGLNLEIRALNKLVIEDGVVFNFGGRPDGTKAGDVDLVSQRRNSTVTIAGPQTVFIARRFEVDANKLATFDGATLFGRSGATLSAAERDFSVIGGATIALVSGPNLTFSTPANLVVKSAVLAADNIDYCNVAGAVMIDEGLTEEQPPTEIYGNEIFAGDPLCVPPPPPGP